MGSNFICGIEVLLSEVLFKSIDANSILHLNHFFFFKSLFLNIFIMF